MANTDADGYPGLNKKHGFYRMMERNQRDRDDYNQRVEEMKDIRKHEAKLEKKASRKPTRELYRPPPFRCQRPTEEHKPGPYCINIEVEPGKWHRQVVPKIGFAEDISCELACQFGFNESKRNAITEMILQFEDKLKIGT